MDSLYIASSAMVTLAARAKPARPLNARDVSAFRAINVFGKIDSTTKKKSTPSTSSRPMSNGFVYSAAQMSDVH
jgi:hypothetical protein